MAEKESVKGKGDNPKMLFQKIVFSDFGESSEYSDEVNYENNLSSYGACMEMASHTTRVLINNFPWGKASVKKIETPMKDRNDISVIKLVTIRLDDTYSINNPELQRVLQYMVGMLEYENSNKFSPMLRQLYTDALAAHKFAIDRYTVDKKSGKMVSITFRFALTKWDGKWGGKKPKVEETETVLATEIPVEKEVPKAKKSTPTKKPAAAKIEKDEDEITSTIGDIIKNKQQ